MARKRVVRTEEFTDEDAREEQEKEDAKRKTKKKSEEPEDGDEGEEDLSRFIKGIPKKDLAHYNIRLRRVSPQLWKGRRISGLIDEFTPPVNPMEIKDSYGGGIYQFEVIKGNRTVGTFREEFPGDPIIHFEDDEKDKPEKTQDPNELVTSHLKRKLGNAELKQAIQQVEEITKEEPGDTGGEYMIDPEEIAKKSARMVLKYLDKQGQNNQTAALLTALAPLLKPPDQTPLITALLQIIAAKDSHSSNQLQPKDIVSMVSPLMGEFVRSQSEIRKMEMQNVGAIQSAMMNRMMDLMSSSGAEQDEIDKVRKWMGFAQEALGGIGSLIKISKPAIPATRRIAPPAADKTKTEVKPVETKPVTGENAPVEPPKEEESKELDVTELTPEKLSAYRVNVFLKAIETEMQVHGDPDAIYDENFETVFYSLPGDVRETVLASSDQMAIFQVFEKYADKNLLSNIMKLVMEKKEDAKWMVDFLDIIREADKDRKGEDTDNDEEKGDGVPK